MLNFNFENIRGDLNQLLSKKRFYLPFILITLISVVYFFEDKLRRLKIDKKGYEKKERFLTDQINYRLEEIRDRRYASYVAINLFKINPITGEEEMDRLYEAEAPTLLKLGPIVRDYPTKPFDRSLRKLKRMKRVYIKNALTYKEDTYLASTINELGLSSVFYVGLYDLEIVNYKLEDGCMGFVTYEFSHPTDFTDQELKDMIREVELIIPYIIKKHGKNNRNSW